MLSLQDLLDFCDLGHKEIEAIADHQRVPLTVAAEIGQQLLNSQEGLIQLHNMMIDNMRHALANGQKDHLISVTETFLNFHRNYPITAQMAA